MKHITNLALPFLLLSSAFAQNLPTPDHILVVVMENKGYSNIVGNSQASYINSLIGGANTAVFTESYALTHPSQPNYIMLYSGDNQGVNSDNLPSAIPFTSCNLGASLIDSGYTFVGYSEDLPALGSTVTSSGAYVRRHAPWTFWQGSGVNQLPDSANQPYSNFPPSFLYDSLPTVSFIIPNLNHDMHDPPLLTPLQITNGDDWLSNHINDYVLWAKTHKSLLIITFDEDDGIEVGGIVIGGENNKVTTIFIGQDVLAGTYSDHIDHYDILRTIEDMYHLPYCGNSASATPITNCWISPLTKQVNLSHQLGSAINIFPVPATQTLNINIQTSSKETVKIMLYNMLGTLLQTKIGSVTGQNRFSLDVSALTSGNYIVKVVGSSINESQKIFIER